MAAIQMGGHAVNGGDMSCKNSGVTDIAAGTAVIVDTSNAPSGADPISIKVPATSGSVAKPWGITIETIKAGEVGRVRRLGAYPCTASGSITVGDFLQIDSASSKEGRVKTCGAATAQIGQAGNSAADGELVQVWISIAANA